jgi:hypothetical protein
MKKVNKEILDKIKIWWNLSYENNNTERYNECEEMCDSLLSYYIEMYKYKKYGKSWDDLKMNDLCYIPQYYKDKRGILTYYYTKDDIQRICNESKIIGKHVWKHIKGERVEAYFQELKEQYYQYFTKEPTANLYKSKLSVHMFKALSPEQQEEIYKVLDKKTGKRIIEKDIINE